MSSSSPKVTCLSISLISIADGFFGSQREKMASYVRREFNEKGLDSDPGVGTCSYPQGKISEPASYIHLSRLTGWNISKLHPQCPKSLLKDGSVSRGHNGPASEGREAT